MVGQHATFDSQSGSYYQTFMNAHVEGFKGLKPLKPFAYPYPYLSKPLPLSEGKDFNG